ncbi:hypothetical protein [Pseudomonas sp. 7-41]|uniref:hypothetical protein n=1 Tax=Pseudomonas sp. 7-41 TaxID=2898483 RepID=UPI001E4BBAA8|nr:hypothetical protein [Pseudomonas sp. 7-41]UHG95140.1 hypothetical protein LQ249_15585 [Pseudomonas sp. 7-41]
MDDSQHRDVYAHFGLAMYLAQCLEQSIFVHLMFFDFFPRNVKNFKEQERWQQDFDRYESEELGKTMGRLIQAFNDAGQPTDEIKVVLTNVLVQRNRLAHKYFSEKSIAFMTESGRSEMITELESIQEMFGTAMAMIDAITMPVARSYGLTEEMQRRVMEEMMTSQSNNASD